MVSRFARARVGTTRFPRYTSDGCGSDALAAGTKHVAVPLRCRGAPGDPPATMLSDFLDYVVKVS